MSNIHVEIVQPTGVKLDLMIDSIILPGIDGDFEVLADHTPFITKLRPGTLVVHKEDQEIKYAIHDGFVTVENNRIIVISDTVESSSEIDIKRAEAAKERAEKRLFSENKESIDFRRAEIALHRAIARINTIS
jgi:F-type H+-transporting ATPase subunit epsilon